MSDNKNLKADFCIEIDFDKNSENPSRIFQSMSNLIDTFQDIDGILIKSIDSKLETSLMLEDIEAGSLKTWLINTLNVVDDDALKNIDWKPLIGQYLIKGKYIILNKLKGKTTITDRKDIQEIQQELLEYAEKTNVRQIPTYSPISPKEVVTSIEKIITALEPLSKKDKASYIIPEGATPFNLDFYISPEAIEELITKEELESRCTMIMKVKKPDYLGESRWEFMFDNHIINVKITDQEWLKEFQNREKDVRPGDSIRAEVVVRTKYGYDLSVIGIYYEAIKILEVLKFNGGMEQLGF